MRQVYKIIAHRIKIELDYHAMMRSTDFDHSLSCNIALMGFAESLAEDLTKDDPALFDAEVFLKLCGIKE